MKPGRLLLTLALIFVFHFSIQAQEKWISDEEMQFKIKIPDNFSQNQMRDGSDKVFTMMSPDQNIFVRVRAMQANKQFTADLLQQVFEQNIIAGANRLMNENGDLHGIPARASAYTWKVDGNDAILGVYYIIQNNFAYVVWTAIPKNQADKYSAQADKIIDSFELLKPNTTYTLADLKDSNSTAVTITDSKMGIGVNKNLKVRLPLDVYSPYTNKIHLSFSYSGNTNSSPFLLKWYSRTHNQLVKEHSLATPFENNGHGYGFISNNGNPWPPGEYYVEIWCNEKLLKSNEFIIQ